MTTTKVALYCRVSTIDQYPENQVRVLTELSQKNDAEIVATFIDPRWPLQIPPPLAGQIPPGKAV